MDIKTELDAQRFSMRLLQAFVGIVLLASILLGRLVYLQVIQHEHYSTLSTQNRIALVPVPPTRGLILDRKGRVLAENRPMYTLEVVPERAGNIKNTLARLREILPISDDDIKSFYRDLRRRRPFESVILRRNLSDAEMADFAVRRYQFPGVEINARLHRYYPYGMLAGHLLGYVGRLNAQDLNRIDPSEYAGLDYIGKDGVELAYESLLRGQPGYKQVEINSHGRVVRDLETVPAVPGQNLVLSIDLDVQRAAEQAMGNRQGAVVALNVKTGEVLALVSVPGYDPNWFVDGINSVLWSNLQADPYHPMINRFLRSSFPPGSTFKPFMALAGLTSGVLTADHKTYCPGFFRLPHTSHKYYCWKRSGHGSLDVEHALAQSCDVFFYTTAMNLGIERMDEYLRPFGFGQKTGIDLAGERTGLLPSPAWKEKRYKQPWYPGETVIAGIGQGYVLATPLQLARATAVIANGGFLVQPRLGRYLVDSVTGRRQSLLVPPQPTAIHFSKEDIQTVRDGMRLVVTGGTAHNINNGPVPIAGKTGTAQVARVTRNSRGQALNSSDEFLKDHALFTAYAPADDPQIAVAVIVEHGVHGNVTAAPVAKAVIDAYLAPHAASATAPATSATEIPPGARGGD